MSNEEFLSQLRQAGFDVPEWVVKTWGSPNSHVKNRRHDVERWLRNKLKNKPAPLPQWMPTFDIHVRKFWKHETST